MVRPPVGTEEDGFILSGVAVVEMREAGGEPRPAVHFCEEVRQLDTRQEIISRSVHSLTVSGTDRAKAVK